MKGFGFSWKYALVIGGIALLAFMVMDFNSRMANLRNLSLQRDRMEAQATSLQAVQERLQADLEYATSEAAVRRWAYEDGRMNKPGDFPVAPIPPAESTPAPSPVQAPRRTPVANWQVWMWLFVDDPVQ